MRGGTGAKARHLRTRMYERRLRGYAAIGYSAVPDSSGAVGPLTLDSV